MSVEHNSARKSLLLFACRCWPVRLSLREMNQIFKFGGTIGYGDSYLDIKICDCKVFRLQAILLDATVAVQ